MIKNPPCNVGDVSSILGQGIKLPHALEQLNLRAIREPVHQNTDPVCSN